MRLVCIIPNRRQSDGEFFWATYAWGSAEMFQQNCSIEFIIIIKISNFFDYDNMCVNFN